ncbi:MAG: hypothetical protein GY816_03155 [Cytophagales bacterium]|nr:hypothetical protein [Cytophagales bacterium]
MRVYFDENTSLYIANSINVLESRKKEITVFHTKAEFGKGEVDEVIVRKVHENKGVLFSQDDDFKKAQEVVEAMKAYPIGFFYFKQPKKTSYWNLVSVYMKCWLEARTKIKYALLF